MVCVDMICIVSEFIVFESYILLCCYVELIGLVFQVQDDIFDLMVSIEILGKFSGLDVVLGKNIFLLLFGLDIVWEELVKLY